MGKIKIFNYPWHLAHQYELLKIPNTEWSWLEQHRRQYNTIPRGDMIKEFSVKLVPHYEKGKYDVALLHLDQQCLESMLWEKGKGSILRELDSVITDIPKIVIMHGTPYYPESFSCDIKEDNYKELGFTEKQIGCSSVLINQCKKIIGDKIMVCNSHRAQEQWGFGQTIWHGLDPDEWWDLPKEPRVVTMISPGGLDKYYDRTFFRAVKDFLEEKNITLCHITVDAQFKSFDEYRNFLGRSLIYFNPTRESPMPRARSEAMLSGCCVITTPHQDADTFIEDGVNGFIVKRNPTMVATLVEELLHDYKRAIEIGQKGKETAKKIFDIKRYQNDWTNLFIKTIQNYDKK